VNFAHGTGRGQHGPRGRAPAGRVAAACVAASLLASGCAAPRPPAPPRSAEVGFIVIDADITLRRMVVECPSPQGTVLFLHGFPETLYAWKDIALALSDEYEVHAIDWPGFGQSSRPPVERFAYAPRDYARILGAYVAEAGLDTSRLAICATDIGALPALLLALEQPGIARTLVVGDFAPFDRPQYLYESLRDLKGGGRPAELVHAHMNRTRDEILANAFRRGLPEEAQFEISAEFRDDMARGWDAGGMTSADAFRHYYAHFTRDQRDFEARRSRLRTPVRVLWGTDDVYIDVALGLEFAAAVGTEPRLLHGVGHYPHLQCPEAVIEEVRAAFR